jgi:uncharacterized repeat protein (TIGR01451 family)
LRTVSIVLFSCLAFTVFGLLPDTARAADADNDGFGEEIDCDDANSAVHPGAAELPDEIDNNCNGRIDEGPVDADGDGYPAGEDCDDLSIFAHPGATELFDGRDNDCDGERDEGFEDADGDGYPAGPDCDDTHPSAYPGGREVFDGLDNDCNGETDEGFTDADNDGHAAGPDCDDADPAINPAAEELFDGRDNNCNRQTDEGFTDADGDGHPSTTDCNDGSADVHPGAIEIADDIDNNCDGEIDEGFEVPTPEVEAPAIEAPAADEQNDTPSEAPASDSVPGADSDETAPALQQEPSQSGPPDEDGDGVTVDLDCDDQNPAIYPDAPEIADGLDNNCNREVDEGLEADEGRETDPAPAVGQEPSDDGPPDNDNDGFTADLDCDDRDANIFPGAPEITDGLDNNCNHEIDEGLAAEDAGGAEPAPAVGQEPSDDGPPDNDNDGFTADLDCDDGDANVFPGAPELADDIDNNCNREVDEGIAETDDGAPGGSQPALQGEPIVPGPPDGTEAGPPLDEDGAGSSMSDGADGNQPVPAPMLFIDIAADMSAPWYIGDTGHFAITVRNRSASFAVPQSLIVTSVVPNGLGVITDTLPGGAGGKPPSPWLCILGNSEGQQQISCHFISDGKLPVQVPVGALPPIEFDVSIDEPPSGHEHTSCATVALQMPAGAGADGPQHTSCFDVELTARRSDLEVITTGPESCASGDFCAFQVAVRNVGVTPYEGVVSLQHEPSAENARLGGVVSQGGGWSCLQATPQYPIVCAAAPAVLEPGQSSSFTVRVEVPASVPPGSSYEACTTLAPPHVGEHTILFVQFMLSVLGLDPGPVDGFLGPQTNRAISAYQQSVGLFQSGKIDRDLLTNLTSLSGVDANDRNNTGCTTIELDPLSCDFGQQIVDDACAPICTDAGTNWDGERCIACPAGSYWHTGRLQCVENVLQCNALTTVRQGGSCACRYDGMEAISSTECQCLGGAILAPGRGCLPGP